MTDSSPTLMPQAERRGKILAVVSGKGGSGKTMLAVSLAQGLAIADRTVMLVDADFATGGLSYYLTFREFGNSRVGISDLLDHYESVPPLETWAAQKSFDDLEYDSLWMSNIRLAPIGDQRRFSTADRSPLEAIADIIRQAADLADIVIVDCRGGIDIESLGVCQLSDEILIVVETDTTSIRTSQHLIEVLAEYRIKSKVVGFVLNKVMDDPTPLAKTVGALLSIGYLGAVPFDIEATRSYIQGRIPSPSSLFSRQIFSIIPKIYKKIDRFKSGRVISPEEFGSVTLKSPEAGAGGVFIFGISLYLSAIYIWVTYSGVGYRILSWQYLDVAVMIISNILLVLALSDATKQILGRFVRGQNQAIVRFFGLKRQR
ncbi:flagellar biosynthesis protein FlhG [Sphingomonas sp. NFR04]|uniref:AAA family ATPase n=1 Tax=Sphingomonas sp. NFR04 TaxID=1566283 RepID=UPI0008EFCF1B|nr:ParA family protein [Sphingomonas sp. NFR04]SFK16717.1 flagellar biosynthesis protein FlhG [Sphingomonas sp. NFR04]